jgi:hypothetical protein
MKSVEKLSNAQKDFVWGVITSKTGSVSMSKLQYAQQKMLKRLCEMKIMRKCKRGTYRFNHRAGDIF